MNYDLDFLKFLERWVKLKCLFELCFFKLVSILRLDHLSCDRVRILQAGSWGYLFALLWAYEIADNRVILFDYFKYFLCDPRPVMCQLLHNLQIMQKNTSSFSLGAGRGGEQFIAQMP